MTWILAHGFGGTESLPLPKWLLAYSIGFAVVLVFIGLRVVATKPKRARVSAPERVLPHAPFVITRAVGLVGFVLVVVIAAIGVDDSGANIAPVALIVLFFLGMQAVCAIAGDVFWLVNPFDTIALTLPRRSSRRSPDPHWTAAAFLFAFVWFVFAYPEFYPPTPRNVAWFLAIYTIAVITAATTWGRGWIRDGEGFGGLYGLLGRKRDRAPSSGTVALLCVYLGAIGFDGLSQTNWWIEVLGTSRGWNERLLNTVGLVWAVLVVAVVYLAASHLTGRITDNRTSEVAIKFAPMLVPLGLAWSVAHYITPFLVDVQNFIALLSDPLGRGWDLFGTIDNIVDYNLLTKTQTGWIQTVVLVAGVAASAYEVHRAAYTTYRGRVAVRATYPFAAALVLAAVGAVTLLLGT